MDTFEYLLGITHHLEAKRKQRLQKKLEIDEKQEDKLQELFLGGQNGECPFHGSEIGDKQYSLPLAHLIYMPQQETYLQGLGERLPFESKEKLLFSNKDLPPILRILIPKVETTAQYRKLQ